MNTLSVEPEGRQISDLIKHEVHTKRAILSILNKSRQPWSGAEVVVGGVIMHADPRGVLDLTHLIGRVVTIYIGNKNPMHNLKITKGLDITI